MKTVSVAPEFAKTIKRDLTLDKQPMHYYGINKQQYHITIRNFRKIGK